MNLYLRDIEPFNIPPVANEDAAKFMKHLTGNESFDFNGSETPQSMMIYDLKYNYPRHSYASGWLLSLSYDEIQSESSRHSTMEDFINAVKVGSIQIEFGGTISGISISARNS